MLKTAWARSDMLEVYRERVIARAYSQRLWVPPYLSLPYGRKMAVCLNLITTSILSLIFKTEHPQRQTRRQKLGTDLFVCPKVTTPALCVCVCVCVLSDRMPDHAKENEISSTKVSTVFCL